MTIRQAIQQLLESEEQRQLFAASPADFFADHGFEELPAELLGTAFVHYSDTATLAESDLVAPITTAFAPIPLTDEDRAAYGPSDDPFSLADGVIYVDADTDHLDPIDLSDDDYRSSAPESVDSPDADPEPTATGFEPRDLTDPDSEVEFGSGHEPGSPVEPEPTAVVDVLASDEGFDGDPLDLTRPAEDFVPDALDALDGGSDPLDTEADPSTYQPDIDPADLDFDIL